METRGVFATNSTTFLATQYWRIDVASIFRSGALVLYDEYLKRRSNGNYSKFIIIKLVQTKQCRDRHNHLKSITAVTLDPKKRVMIIFERKEAGYQFFSRQK
eukprot:442086_1